jgi:hypothetical protein
MVVYVHRGKGAKDRYVPLPVRTLTVLREYWATHRNPVWLFPATGRDHDEAGSAASPMARSSVHGAMKLVVQELGFRKRITIHTLRNASAYYTTFRRIAYFQGNSCCPGVCFCSWRPAWTASTAARTPGSVSDSWAIIQGARGTTCVAGNVFSAIRRRTTVWLTCNALAACSIVSQATPFS